MDQRQVAVVASQVEHVSITVVSGRVSSDGLCRLACAEHLYGRRASASLLAREPAASQVVRAAVAVRTPAG